MAKVSSLPMATSVSTSDLVLGVSGGKAALIPISAIEFTSPSASEEEIKAAVLALHPVNSYYWSSVSTSPAELFGGTWSAVTDGRMLYATDNTNTGGASSVTISTSNMPAHSHTINSHTHSDAHKHVIDGTHTHEYHHTHSKIRHAHVVTGVPSITQTYMRFKNSTGLTQNCPVTDLKDTHLLSTNYTNPSYGMDLDSMKGSSSAVAYGPKTTSTIHSLTSTQAATATVTTPHGDISSAGSSSVSIAITPPCEDAYCWVRTE